jgi:hypothetical protein
MSEGGIAMRRRRSSHVLVALPVLGLVLTGCAGWGGGTGGSPDSLNVLMVNNPQMVDLQKLTADHFTKQTGIRVNFTVLPENDVRRSEVRPGGHPAADGEVDAGAGREGVRRAVLR